MLSRSFRFAKSGIRGFSSSALLNKGVYFDVTINDRFFGRLEMDLYDEIAPKTCENFRALCTGEKGFGYKGTNFFQSFERFGAVGGDVVHNDGSSGKSIYGETFADETFARKHSTPGLLTMKNVGPDTNNSQFIITYLPTPWLDGKNVCFGEITKGFEEVVERMELNGKFSGVPDFEMKIVDCGELD